MSGTLVDSQSLINSIGNAPEASGGTPAAADVRPTDLPAQGKDEISLSIALSKGIAPAPNGMNPLPVHEHVESTLEPPGAEAIVTPTAVEVVAVAAPVEVDAAMTPAMDVSKEAETAMASKSSGVEMTTKTGLGEMVELKEALAQATAGATPEGQATDEKASTNSLKDDPGTPEECNLFVGDLARNLTEEKLEKAFQHHGRVMSVSIKRDRATGKNLGYGFVKMSSHQEARTAKEAMQNVELGGRRVRVGWAQKNTSLYVGGLEPGITTQMLIGEFARFGPLDKELTAIKPGAKCGFVKYRYRLHAETAKKDLNNRPAFGGQCPSLHIEWNSVESGPDGSEAVGSTDGNASEKRAGSDMENTSTRSSGSLRPGREGSVANSVHVQFEGEQAAVSGVNEMMIKKTFTQWEPILNVVIPSSRFNGVSPGPRQLPRCWGFVHFPPTPEGEEAAKDAIEALTGTTIAGMKVHCTMSRSSSGQGQGGNSGAGGWRKNVGISGGSNRSRRGSLDRGADDHSRQMMPHGGGQGFGGRPGRSSLDGAGRGGWGANPGMRPNVAIHQRHHPFPHFPPPHGQPHHMPHHPTAGHGPHLMQQHAHQPHTQHPPQQHQQQLYGYGAAATAGYAGQYLLPTATPPAGAGGGGEVAGAAGAAGTAGDMMMQTPYGVSPYPYMFQGVPYAAAAQQGYPIGYPQMYGFPYPSTGMGMDPSMLQGQVAAAGVQQQQAGGASTGQQPAQQPSPMHQNPTQGQAVVPSPQTATPLPQQQQQAQQHMAAQRQAPSQLQTQQQAARAVAQRQMGMQPMIMPGAGNPAGLNVGVPTYMPMYQLPQMPPGGTGAQGVSEPSVDQEEAKHGE